MRILTHKVLDQCIARPAWCGYRQCPNTNRTDCPPLATLDVPMSWLPTWHCATQRDQPLHFLKSCFVRVPIQMGPRQWCRGDRRTLALYKIHLCRSRSTPGTANDCRNKIYNWKVDIGGPWWTQVPFKHVRLRLPSLHLALHYLNKRMIYAAHAWTVLYHIIMEWKQNGHWTSPSITATVYKSWPVGDVTLPHLKQLINVTTSEWCVLIWFSTLGVHNCNCSQA